MNRTCINASAEMVKFNRWVEYFDAVTKGRFDRCDLAQIRRLYKKGVVPTEASFAYLAVFQSAGEALVPIDKGDNCEPERTKAKT